jgi:hypothetical protein
LKDVNQVFQKLDIKPKKLRSEKEIIRKSLDVGNKLVKLAAPDLVREENLKDPAKNTWEALLSEFADPAKTDGEKIRILIIAASSKLSSWELSKCFGAPRRMAETAVDIYNRDGILGEKPKKKGRPLPEEKRQAVVDFYLRDEISRQMPGRADFKSVVVALPNTRTRNIF